MKQRHGDATQISVNHADETARAQAPQPDSQVQLASTDCALPTQDHQENFPGNVPATLNHTNGGEQHEAHQRVDGTDAAVPTEIDRLDSLLETVSSSDLRIAQQIVRALRSKVRLYVASPRATCAACNSLVLQPTKQPTHPVLEPCCKASISDSVLVSPYVAWPLPVHMRTTCLEPPHPCVGPPSAPTAGRGPRLPQRPHTRGGVAHAAGPAAPATPRSTVRPLASFRRHTYPCRGAARPIWVSWPSVS